MSAHRAATAASATRRLRWAPLSIAAGVLATGAIALSMNGTLAAFTASITHGSNTAGAATLGMQETGTAGVSGTCNSNDGTAASVAANAASCTTMNLYGAATGLVPGGSTTQSVAIKNTGTAKATTFTLTPGSCTQTAGTVNGGATDLCSKMTVAITQNGTSVYSGTLAGLNTGGAITLAALDGGATANYSFTVTLPAGLGNSYQGLTATQSLAWAFSAGS
jgi:hypothetical protein